MQITSLTWHHAWWIPAVILYYVGYSWLSKLNNDHSHIEPWYTSKYLWAMFVFGLLCPFWLIVGRVSKNLLFDGMLYDNIMLLTYVGTMVMLRAGDTFLVHHWIGLVFVVIGSIMMRINT